MALPSLTLFTSRHSTLVFSTAVLTLHRSDLPFPPSYQIRFQRKLVAVADSFAATAFEEARNQRLEENRRKFQDSGISSISKTLSHLTASPNKTRPLCVNIETKSKECWFRYRAEKVFPSTQSSSNIS